MTDANSFKCYKRLINRHLLQVSGLCSTPFLSYLPKRSMQIYRAQYGDAMLVLLYEGDYSSLVSWNEYT